MITNKLNSKRGGKVYVAFVNYKKAFDTVNREALWDILKKIQTSTKTIMILKSMYNSVKSCIKLLLCKPVTVFRMHTGGETRVSAKSSYLLTPDLRSG